MPYSSLARSARERAEAWRVESHTPSRIEAGSTIMSRTAEHALAKAAAASEPSSAGDAISSDSGLANGQYVFSQYCLGLHIWRPLFPPIFSVQGHYNYSLSTWCTVCGERRARIRRSNLDFVAYCTLCGGEEPVKVCVEPTATMLEYERGC